MDQTTAFPETRTTPIIELKEIPPRRKPLKIRVEYGWTRDEGDISPTFSAIATLWLPGDPDEDPSMTSLNHDLVLKAFPWLNLMVTVHGRDACSGEIPNAAAVAWGLLKPEDQLHLGTAQPFPSEQRDATHTQQAASILGCDPALLDHVAGVKDLQNVIDRRLRTVWNDLAHSAIDNYRLADPKERPPKFTEELSARGWTLGMDGWHSPNGEHIAKVNSVGDQDAGLVVIWVQMLGEPHRDTAVNKARIEGRSPNMDKLLSLQP